MHVHRPLEPRLVLLAACVLVNSVCCGGVDDPLTATESFPIVNGVPDSAPDYPGVGLLTISSTGSKRWCSATLIGGRTALTAAHCLNEDATYTVSFRSTRYAVERVIPHPEFEAGEVGGAADIGLIQLERAVDLAPARIPFSPPEVDEPITLVGYGNTRTNRDDGRVRRRADNVVERTDSHRLYFAGSEDDRGNTCEGDSGGAVFAGEGAEPQLKGVISGGYIECGILGWATRTDVYHDWLLEQSGGDLTEVGFGAACAQDADCGDLVCADIAEGGFCTRACDLADPACPHATSCVSLDQRAVCLPSSSHQGVEDTPLLLVGGCSLQAQQRPSGQLAIFCLLALLLCQSRRRTRHAHYPAKRWRMRRQLPR